MKTASLLNVVQCPRSSIYYLDLVPRICPTTRLDTPIPTICMEVARPMAVPRVAWGTTRGMDGHMLAWSHRKQRSLLITQARCSEANHQQLVFVFFITRS